MLPRPRTPLLMNARLLEHPCCLGWMSRTTRGQVPPSGWSPWRRLLLAHNGLAPREFIGEPFEVHAL